MKKTLFAISFKSVGAGFFALNSSGFHEQIKILEMIPLGRESLILGKGSAQAVQAFVDILPFVDLKSVHRFEVNSDRVERVFYSLEHALLAKELLIIEGESLGALLELAEQATSSFSLQVVDIKIPRGSGRPWGVLFLTGDVFAAEFVRRVRALGLEMTQIAKPTDALRSYFD